MKKRPLINLFLLSGTLGLLLQPVFAQRDPTKPASYQQAVSQGDVGISTDELAVKAIIHGRSRQFALIGDQYVTVGGSVAGAKVVEIKANSVVFQDPKTGKHSIFQS